jgi:23S rRNA (adenine2503-C2)-methyltransferase
VPGSELGAETTPPDTDFGAGASTAALDPYELDRAGLEELLVGMGEPAYRGRQVHRWLVRGVDDPEAMTDLPTGLRQRLAQRFAMSRPELARHVTVDEGTTHKFLLRFAGGTMIETVLMLYPRTDERSGRATVCISTQAGCAMGCPFCATGQAGLDRQLTAGEVVRQVALAEAFLRDGGAELPDEVPDHVTNVVFMGMGEPLANLRATEAAVRWMHDPDGFDLSARSITVSTVGLVPGIRRLAELGLPLTLAVSLHAPDDELRDVLVPPNRMHPIAAIVAAVRDYQAGTGRRVSFEYVLIDGVNDTDDQADRLAEVVRSARPDRGPVGHVNLIPLNPTPGVPEWREPPPERVDAFAERLRAAGVPTTVRDTKGRDADAACGQLLATYRLGEGRRLPVAVGAAEQVDAVRAGSTGAPGASGGEGAP